MKSAPRKKGSRRVPKEDSHAAGEKFADVLRVDGNAAGGMLGELFALDLTGARAKCAGCGATEMVGALVVYAHGMGMVARCPHCEGVVMRMSRTPTHVWLDARGATSIAVSVPR
ncbi:MAG TPA: DUF6510 family protein [Gemmatimonadaceae bacterium]